MKRYLLLTALILTVLTINVYSNVIFKTNHQVNQNILTDSQVGINNLDEEFMLTRLDYYISEISITHDGGQILEISDFWILANGFVNLSADLGVLEINSIEGISFHIGVDPAHNHLDPSKYPAFHPLAPQTNTMHWGWAAGYRFAALEGKTGSSFNTIFQIHTLGDQNYVKVSLNTMAVNDEYGNKIININADYAQALANIDFASGIIAHGETNENATMMMNFKDLVFSSVNVSDVNDNNQINSFDLYPNPSNDGNIYIDFNNFELNSLTKLIVTDLSGKEIHSLSYYELLSNRITLNISENGVYFVSMIDNKNNRYFKKFVVN